MAANGPFGLQQYVAYNYCFENPEDPVFFVRNNMKKYEFKLISPKNVARLIASFFP